MWRLHLLHIHSKYKLAECVGKWCVELSIPDPPGQSLQSACSTSYPVCFYRSLFANEMNLLLCSCHLCHEKHLSGAQQDSRKTGNQKEKEREFRAQQSKIDETEKDRGGYLHINIGVDS